MLSYRETTEKYAGISANKANMPVGKTVLQGILAGAFISLAGLASTAASCTVTNPSLAKLISGMVFPTGLFCVVTVGAELFTGNALMVMGWLSGRHSCGAMVKNWTVVYLANLLGSLIIAGLSAASGMFDMLGGALGSSLAAAAETKAALSLGAAFSRGILCNFLVCLGVMLALAASSAGGKFIGCLIPVALFIICGFEHCIANMFTFPAGLLAGAQAGIGDMLLCNMLPVTLGNILGGALCLGVPSYVLHLKKEK